MMKKYLLTSTNAILLCLSLSPEAIAGRQYNAIHASAKVDEKVLLQNKTADIQLSGTVVNKEKEPISGVSIRV